MTFSPVNPKKGNVHKSTDVNIKFEVAKTSVQSIVCDNWGVKGNPGPQTTRNWLMIEKFYGDYKLVLCPLVCKFCKVLCRDVGILMNSEVWHLALSDVSFNVTFLKG
ncbi:Kunitz trypsin inhibitor 5 [Citrus sinensis]|nr:Kunitz trypsin inhibitor 5 [Citrus sinensis]